MRIHCPEIIHNSDGTWVVECQQCHSDSTTAVPIGIGLSLPDRLTAERLAANHAGRPGVEVGGR